MGDIVYRRFLEVLSLGVGFLCGLRIKDIERFIEYRRFDDFWYDFFKVVDEFFIYRVIVLLCFI